METIPILYRIAVDENDTISSKGSKAHSDINCFELQVTSHKEVLLIDILRAWAGNHPMGVNFSFYARASGDKMILLESPSCCVPVINNTIYLILKVTDHLPYTPVDQAISWFEKSQRDVYGSSSINLLDRYRFQQSKRQEKKHHQQQPRDSRAEQSRRESPRNQKPPSRQSSNSSTTADDYFDYGDDDQSDYRESSPRNRSPRNSQQEHRRDGFDREDSFERRQADNYSEASKALAGASQATVAAAGTAAKSFFSFASSTIKTVASVTAQGLEAGTELATAGYGIASMSFSGSINVGSYKVAVVKDLAEGGFGKVSLVKDMMAGSEYGKEYALKILLCQTKEQVKDAQNEIRMLKTFNGHPNIIRLLDQASTQKGNGQTLCYMLFPVYRMGTAWDLIEQHTKAGGEGRWPFSEIQCLDIILGTVRALGAMHDATCLHMDMKPHNILLTDTMESVVMDLGSAGPSDVHITSRRDALNLEDEAATKCSGPFRAPELYQVPQDFVMGGWVDIWSLGCTMHCLAFGWSPFENAREGVLKLAILNGRYSTPPRNFNCGVTFSQGYTDLIKAMLQVDYTSRPTAQDVKEHVKALIDDIEAR